MKITIDKYKHAFLGTLLFILLNVLFSQLTSLIIVWAVAILWELNPKRQFELLDIAFTVILPTLIYVIL